MMIFRHELGSNVRIELERSTDPLVGMFQILCGDAGVLTKACDGDVVRWNEDDCMRHGCSSHLPVVSDWWEKHDSD
jgi:hypothetical protein